jgi:branched-chain amino acid transport system permease protein
MMNQLYYWSAVAGLALAGLFIDQSTILHILILFFIWSIVVSGWDLVTGYTGLFSFAQLVFFAVGAYATAMLSINHGMDPLLAMFLAGGVGALVGLIIGLPCLRLRGEYVAMFTFAVHLAMPPLLIQGRDAGTGGSTGLMGIPPPELFGQVLVAGNRIAWYYTALVVAAALIYIIYYRLIPGKWGRAFVTIRDSELFARALGVNEYKYKLLSFSLSAAVTGIAGGMYALYIGVASPRLLGNEFFLMVMLMLAVGGLGRFPGVILGAALITVGNEMLRGTGEFRLLLLGAAVVIVLLLLPHGVVGIRERFGALSRWIRLARN